MKIWLSQYRSVGDVDANIAALSDEVSTEARSHDLVVFPEATMHPFGRGASAAARTGFTRFEESLRTLAQTNQVAIVAGAFAPMAQASADDLLRNRVIIARPDGEVSHYDKIHLYDAFSYRESQLFEPGDALVTVDVAGVTVGVATCYDLRFASQFRALALRGASLIVVPMAWAPGPGKIDQLLRLAGARALDATSIVVTASRAGVDPSEPAVADPFGVGYSGAWSPLGEVLAQVGAGERGLSVDVDAAQVETVRDILPVLNDDESLWLGQSAQRSPKPDSAS